MDYGKERKEIDSEPARGTGSGTGPPLSSSGNYRGPDRAGQRGKYPSFWVLLSQREDMESI